LEAPKKTDVTLNSFFSEFFSTVWVTLTFAARNTLKIHREKKMVKIDFFILELYF
jgi:hypothetical protein